MKAMILAAGRGARLSPLTDSTPKPLIEVHGRPLIDWQLDKLDAAGFSEIVINIGYLGEKIRRHFDSYPRERLKIEFSVEPESALETGGGIVQALPYLDGRPFALVNADVWTDFDFRRLKRIADVGGKRSWRGHLILVPNPAHNKYGDFALNNGWIHTRDDETRQSTPNSVHSANFTFSGISVLDPELFQEIEPGRFPLAPILNAAADNNQLTGEVHSNHWSDIGTMERLNEINVI